MKKILYLMSYLMLSTLSLEATPDETLNTQKLFPFFQVRKEQPYHLSVGAVLFNKKGEIACHYFDKVFGHQDIYILMRESMENEETPLMTLNRGLMEEFGAKAEAVAFLGTLCGNIPDSPTAFEKTTLYIAAKLIEWDVTNRYKDDPEGNSQIKWMKPSELISLMQNQKVRFNRIDLDESEIIKRALPFIQTNV